MKIPRKLTCKRCGESWPPKVKHPVRCPRCFSPSWNRARKKSNRRVVVDPLYAPHRNTFR